jgi:serpin B
MWRRNRLSRIRVIISLALLLSWLLSCAPVPPATLEPVRPTGDAPPTSEPGGGSGSKVLKSEMERDLSPDVSDQEMGVLIAGNSNFAWDFYQAVRGQDGNLFYSPYSISTALAMTYAGAHENTALQMAEALNFELPQERLHPAFNALNLSLTGQGESASNTDESQPFQLNVANSLWAQDNYPFLPEFLDLLGRNYGAGLRLVDFVSDAEGARVEINDWVAEETGGKIKDLIPEGAIDDLTRLVLANAIYFKADWYHPFEKAETRDGPFILLDGNRVQVPMISHETAPPMPYKAGDGYQVIELPYIGETTSMVILVPDAGGFEDFEASLDGERVKGILEGVEPRMVSLTMPKFSFESEFSLKNTLAAMGIADAFDGKLADFSGMDGTKDLHIGDVFHKAFVAVDEKGTEAAAATAVIMKLESAPLTEIELTIDRPFIFLIQDKPSGAILFIGRVLNPED